MIEILFLATILFLIFLGIGLFSLIRRGKFKSDPLSAIWEGFKDALMGCGFLFGRQRYPVELYIWMVYDEDEAPAACCERAAWPPMDIADWIKEGLPNTPEAEFCRGGDNCHCELVRYKPRVSRRV